MTALCCNDRDHLCGCICNRHPRSALHPLGWTCGERGHEWSTVYRAGEWAYEGCLWCGERREDAR